MKDSYSALANEEADSPVSTTSEDEKSNIRNTRKDQEHAKLLKQCFVYIVFATIFIFATTTTIVLGGTAKCRAHPPSKIANPVPIFIETPLDTQKAHEKALSMFPSPQNTPKDAKFCGPNAAAATAKGCHLDMISFTWLPHECYDAELSAEFMSLNNWTWALDANGTTLVPYDEVAVGNITNGWVTWEYHLTHCLYTWKKLVRHLERGGAMDWYVMSFDHTRHCSKLLLQEGVDRQEYNSEFFVQYPACGYA
jgi:hypothetical protein